MSIHKREHMSKQRLPTGLGECSQCGKIFATTALGPLETGNLQARRWDTRPKTAGPGLPGRGLDSGRARVGAFPSWKGCLLPEVVRCCAACGGAVGFKLGPDGELVPAPEPVSVKTWVASNDAWAHWKELPGGGEWGKFAPRKFRK